MKLKEAFRAQNCLSNLYESVCNLLDEETFERNVTTHQLSQAGLGEDKAEVKPSVISCGEENYQFDKLVDLALALAQEKEKLVIAIEKAKMACDESFDSLKQNNIVRQSLIFRLTVLNKVKAKETSGTADFYGKDNDGKQALFHYPTKTICSYDVDKNHLKAILKRLRGECEETSLKLDQMMVSIDVDYNCRFDYDSSVEDIYLDYSGR